MKREKTITLRVNASEKRTYEHLAKLKGKPLAELIRYLLDKELDRVTEFSDEAGNFEERVRQVLGDVQRNEAKGSRCEANLNP